MGDGIDEDRVCGFGTGGFRVREEGRKNRFDFIILHGRGIEAPRALRKLAARLAGNLRPRALTPFFHSRQSENHVAIGRRLGRKIDGPIGDEAGNHWRIHGVGD